MSGTDPLARRKVVPTRSDGLVQYGTDATDATMPDWIKGLYDLIGGGANGYVYTPDDLNAIATALQLMDLQNQYAGYQTQQKQYQLTEDQIKQAGDELGLSKAQLEEKWAEFNFQKEQAPLQHQVDMQNLQNQLILGGYDVDTAKQNALTQAAQTEAAKYGAEMAKYNMMAETGLIAQPFVPMSQKMRGYGYQG